MRYTFYGLTVTTDDFRHYNVSKPEGTFLGTIFQLRDDKDKVLGFVVDDGRMVSTLPGAANLYNEKVP